MLFRARARHEKPLVLLVPLPLELLAAHCEVVMTRHRRRAPDAAIVERRDQRFALRVEIGRRAVERDAALARLIELRARSTELGFRVAEHFLAARGFRLCLDARFLEPLQLEPRIRERFRDLFDAPCVGRSVLVQAA